jgi:hypothetical protein
MEAMLRKERERASRTEPKKSGFRFQGKDVTAKVNRYKYEHTAPPFGVDINWDMDKNTDSAGMIPAIADPYMNI